MSWASEITAWILRLLSNKKPYVAKQKEVYFRERFASTAEFFAHFGNKFNFGDKTVLDIGCDTGATCFYMAFNGAKKVVGTDINEEAINFAKKKLTEYPSLADVISFFTLKDLPKEQFDIVLSKDSFEHYSNPESFMKTMKQYLKLDGIMVIGFCPLWKSPYGGHIKNFSSLPWIHLLFPEPILMKELRRYYKDQRIESFSKIIGGSGLNKMTYERFLRIVKDNGLEFDYIDTNTTSRSPHKYIAKIFKLLSRLPQIRDYLTVSVYCILRIKH